MNEHYCRRWISVKTIVESLKQNKSHFLDAQISVMKIAVMSFWSFHQQPKTLSKRLFEKYIRRYFDYSRDEEKI
jgi:hypothetical protein